MVGKYMQIKHNDGFRPPMLNDDVVLNTITVNDFIVLHQKFIRDKTLEGLAQRTLLDHETHFKYLTDYLEEEYRSTINRMALTGDVLKGYIYHMVQEKQYKPCTINVRMRTLKCYLKWLFNEKYIPEDLSIKLKLVKVPQDSIKPLNDIDVRKILKMPNRETYAGFRDFSLMVLMLDCGVRVNETVNIKIDDVNLKEGLINIRGENAKTRIERQVPISSKTCKILKKLIEVDSENSCEYVFCTNTGEKAKASQIIQNFARAGKRAGIQVRCTPHIFRHTFAVNAVRAKMDIFTLQKIMGHSTLITTRKYIQLGNEDLIKSHNGINLVDKYIK